MVSDRWEGVVIKPLRPSGSIEVGNEMYDVVTDGEYIDKGTTVVVSEIRGNSIFVLRRKDYNE